MQGFLNVLTLKTPFLEDYFGTAIPLANGQYTSALLLNYVQ